MSKFYNRKLENLVPYVPGEQPRDKKYIKLNTNENPYPPAPGVARAVGSKIADLKLYSDPMCKAVIEPLAAYFGVKNEQVYVGNGSDEVLAFVFQAFCENGAAFADLTYGFYKVFSQLYGVDYEIIKLREDFLINVEDYFEKNKTILIANPNAPTGLALGLSDIECILEKNKETLVVIDEAYVDFGCKSAISLIDKYDNLLVIGTFSKSRSLAGARLGYAVGNYEIIKDINSIKFSFNPFNVNSMTMAATVESIKNDGYFKACCKKVMQTRARTLEFLRNIGFECLESMTNFVLVRHDAVNGKEMYVELRNRGVLVRWFDNSRIDDYIRITMGTDDEMNVMFDAIKDILNIQI